MVSLYIS
ncbi:hypothetical protein F383_08532 [Gossypium arboreum]|nr:hypothetical protein F383_08532 [Gossypium arboreum]